MKRRFVMLGLIVLVVLVFVAALAGPASAGGGQWKPFTATFVPSAHSPGTPWPLWKLAEDPPFVPVRSIDEHFEGTYVCAVDELAGFMVVHTNGTMTFRGGRYYTFAYVNKSTLYVGASSPAPVGDNGVWSMTARGVWRLDTLTGEVSEHLEAVGHGVAGDVKGWVMKFSGSPPLAVGYYLEK
jgi:hypothetical protein